MVEEHLKSIRLKEEEARTRLREAKGQAETIIGKARENGEKFIENVRVEAVDLERSLLAGSRKNAEKKIADLRAENAKNIVTLTMTAKKNQEKALDIIIEAFCGVV